VWRCGDGLLANDVLLKTLHPLLENVLQTICRKLQEDNGTGGLLASELLFLRSEKPRNCMGRDLNSIGLMDKL
jgi:hypothetical protein